MTDDPRVLTAIATTHRALAETLAPAATMALVLGIAGGPDPRYLKAALVLSRAGLIALGLAQTVEHHRDHHR